MQGPVEALKRALSGMPDGARLGVAVSGGGDSVALLVLAAEVLGPRRLLAATVDHRIRPEAAAEAAGVAALCARLGVGHVVLAPGPGALGGNLMAAARAARLALLSGWAREAGLAAVLLGHTRDDQAETVLLRLARGSGVDGLAGMAAARRAGGVLWLRPWLGVGRAALRAELDARGIGWVEDPTNADPRFARSRARQALAALAPLGIDAAGLAATAGRMARARQALEGQARAALEAHLREDSGCVRIDRAVLDLPPEIRDRVLAGAIMGLSGAVYRPRLAALHRVVAALARPGGAACLAGVALRSGADGLWLWREAAAVAGLRAPWDGLWDGRWRALRGDAAADSGADAAAPEIAAIGAAGLALLGRQAAAGLHPHWRRTGLPRAALAGLPAIWRGDRLVAAPLAFWPQGWQLVARPLATLAAPTGEFD